MTTVPLTGHITPTWNIDDFPKLEMRHGKLISSKTDVNDFLKAGHNDDQIYIDVYFEPKIMPNGSDSVRKEFSFLNNLRLAVNCLHPGAYLPWHEDGFDRYLEITNINDSDKIFRAIVMVDDGVPGQYLHIDDTIHHNWKAGDWFGWFGPTMHATYNFSCVKRFAYQVTGTINK